MKKLITSLTLTFLVSAIFGILFRDWLVFGLVTILQFLFFYFFNSIYENFLIKKALETGAEIKKLEFDNSMDVVCPCGAKQTVILSIHEDTIYRCDKCKNEIRAAVNVGTAMVTVPVVSQT